MLAEAAHFKARVLEPITMLTEMTLARARVSTGASTPKIAEGGSHHEHIQLANWKGKLSTHLRTMINPWTQTATSEQAHRAARLWRIRHYACEEHSKTDAPKPHPASDTKAP